MYIYIYCLLIASLAYCLMPIALYGLRRSLNWNASTVMRTSCKHFNSPNSDARLQNIRNEAM